MVILHQPIDKEGSEASNLLKEAKIDFISISKEAGRGVSLSDESSVYPWKGIEDIKSFIATYTGPRLE